MVCKDFYCEKAPCINMELCFDMPCWLATCEHCIYSKACQRATASLKQTFANSKPPHSNGSDCSQQDNFNEELLRFWSF